MTLAPNYRLSLEDKKLRKVRRNKDAHLAVTRYRVLSTWSACSLLELEPITGKQLHAHFFDASHCLSSSLTIGVKKHHVNTHKPQASENDLFYLPVFFH